MKLLPRLNYKFSFSDFIASIAIIFGKKHDNSKLSTLFLNHPLYFINHARTGLRMLLSSLDLKQGSRIGVQAYNCHTIFTSVKNAGYNIVFIDIGEDLCISLSDLENKKHLLDAIIVTHIFGSTAEIKKIKLIVGNIPVIEDCAHAFLSQIEDKIAGNFGDAAVFSIGKGKFPSIGDGGYVVIHNDSLSNNFVSEYNQLKQVSFLSNCIVLVKNILLSLFHNSFLYGCVTYPIKKVKKSINIHSDSLIVEHSGYFLNKQLFLANFNSYSSFKIKMDLNAKLIRNTLADISSHHKIQGSHSFLVPFLSPKPKEIVDFFRINGVELGQHFSHSGEWVKSFGYKAGSCQHFEEVTRSIVTFPCYYTLKKSDLDQIISLIGKFRNYKS